LFCIFFQSGEELRITLWGDNARDFDELALHNLPSLIIIAFAGFRVTEFKGNFNFHLFFFSKNKNFKIFIVILIQLIPLSFYYKKLFCSQGKPNLNSTVVSLWYFNPDMPECLAYKHL
jgi:hypothetical protein